mgnify:CR=1 FL=1
MVDTGSDGRDTGEPLTDDQIMRLLASDTRRAALRELQDDCCVTLDGLASAVSDAGVEAGTDRVRLRLHHCHLPTLETAGVVRYDTDDNCIDYVGDEAVETVLSVLDD